MLLSASRHPVFFQQSIEVTPQVGEEHMAANKGIIHNAGQQTVSAYTNEFLFVSTKFQVTQVHRPLAIVSENLDANKTLVISNKYGRFIMWNDTWITTEVDCEGGTYHMDQLVVQGQA